MMQDDDGLPLDEVGDWATEKHERLQKYIDITRATRRKYIRGSGGAAYIDLYCGSGRSLLRESRKRVDGSPLLAYKCAVDGGAPFSEIHIADAAEECCRATAMRIIAAGGAAIPYVGRAEEVAPIIAERLNPYGLHFAFLDPFNLGALPFTVIRALSKLQRIDMLIHVSIQDLQRNLHEYTKPGDEQLERFAPGWREHVSLEQPQHGIRANLLQYWMKLIGSLGLPPAGGIEKVVGSNRQPLYWLVFASRHELAKEFWNKIRTISGQGDLFGTPGT